MPSSPFSENFLTTNPHEGQRCCASEPRCVTEVSRVIAAVGAPNLGLQFDAYHAHLITGDVAGCWDRHAGLVRHVQIAGAPGRHEPRVGDIDYADFFRRVDAAAYRGWVSAEYVPQTTTEAGLHWLRGTAA